MNDAATLAPRVARLVVKRDASPHEQRSPEWHAMRASMLTASDVGAVLGAKTDKTRRDVLLDKTNRAAPFTGNWATEWGVRYEDDAIAEYCRRRGIADWRAHVLRFGLLQHPTLEWLGASPDGVTRDGRLIEIKVRCSPPPPPPCCDGGDTALWRCACRLALVVVFQCLIVDALASMALAVAAAAVA